jgi:HSP20 family protein
MELDTRRERSRSMALVRRERVPMMWPGDMFRRFFDTDWFEGGWLRIEEFREGDNLIVKAEVPGIDPEKDVEITVTGDVLRVHAKREESSETTKGGGYRSEFRYGSFERDVALPQGVDPDKIEARYADGILTVKVPVHAEKEEVRRVIPVTNKE